MKPILFTALGTGFFCASFAFFIDFATMSLVWWQVVGLSAVSGFMGSLFAQILLRRMK